MTITPPLGDETKDSLTSASVDCSDVTAIARLSIHVKKNNIAYMVGTLVAYQIGALDKAIAFGSGLC
jgi:hypothetical protein